MKPAVLAVVAVATLIPPKLVAADPAAGQATLTIDFHGLQSRRGSVMAALFDSRRSYDANSHPLRSWILPADGGDFSATVSGLAPGDYAVKSFHDLNGDGRMNFNPLGMPLEPYAFSNDARGLFGPPSWRASAFHVHVGDNVQAIRLR